MRKNWIALTVCAGVAAAVAWATAIPTQAAMVVGDGKTNMSLVETAAKKRGKAVCTQKLLWTCCTVPGQQEYCYIKVK